MCWQNRRLQIDARHAALGLPGRRVIVVEKRDKTLAMLYGGRLLSFHIAPVAARSAPPPSVLQDRSRTPYIPAANHPWRRRILRHRSDSAPSDELYKPILGGRNPS